MAVSKKPERKSLKDSAKTKEVPPDSGGAYFPQKRTNIQFIPSGSILLDQVLGGGWPLGRVSNIIGDRSSGKCVRRGYLLLPERGFVDIASMGAEFPEGATPYAQKLAVTNGVEAEATHFYKELISRYATITTEHGFRVEATEKHPLLVWTHECKLVIKQAGAIRKGDVTVIASNTQIFGKPTVGADWAALIGYWVADGLDPRFKRIEISNTRPFVREAVEAIAENLNHPAKLTTSGIGIHSKHLAEKLYEYLDHPEKTTARYKKIPTCILESSKGEQLQFLRALFNCDTHYTKGGCLEYYTASVDLAEQVQLMLLNLGVVCTRKGKRGAWIGDSYYNHVYWRVRVSGPHLQNFFETVGSDKYDTDYKSATHRSSFGTVPYLGDKLREDKVKLKTLLGWSRNGKLKDGSRFPQFKLSQRNITLQLLEKFIETYAHLECPEWSLAEYRELLQAGYHFDTVKSKKTIQLKVPEPVYDFHVPGNHLFWLGGFVNHNTLLAIEAATNAAAAYPDAKIWYAEAEAAFDEDYAASLGLPIDRVEFIQDFLTVEDLFESLIEICSDKELSGLYVVDSLDALSDRAEQGREIDAGSYGAAKAKKMSEMFRRVIRHVKTSNIHLMFISQVRDKMNVSFGKKTGRSGGRALDFYASQIIEISHKGRLKKTRKGVERKIGVNVGVMCEKNKVGLPFRDCSFDIRFGYGIDDLKSCLDWLVATKNCDTIGLNEKDVVSAARRTMAMPDEEFNALYETCKEAVPKLWREIDEGLMPARKKYR